MSHPRFRPVVFFLLSMALLQAQDATNSAPASPATPPPLGPDGAISLSDNAHPPYMAVFQGSVNTMAHPGGIRKNAAYATWLNRTLVWAEDSLPSTRWDSIEGGGWQFDPWGAWVQENPARRLIICVPLIPGKWDGSGTTEGDGAHEKITLEQGAAGVYNAHFQKLAETLVKHKMGNSILRLGWEFPGGWYAWHTQTAAKAASFAEYWRQIVKTMRAVPGAEKLEFAFNPTNGFMPYDPEAAYAGDDYIDYIGPDIYDNSYEKDTYPWPKDTSQEEIEARQKRVWDEVIYSKSAKGLAYWAEFAKKHHKPMCIPEWGVMIKPDKHGGWDNPYYIEQMYKFIQDPANNVAWHSYFDWQAPDGHCRLSPDNGKETVDFPKSAAMFKKLFALPAGTAAAPQTAPAAPVDSNAPATTTSPAPAPAATAPSTNAPVAMANPPPALPASITVTQRVPIEQLEPDGHVSGVATTVIGKTYTPVRIDGSQLVVKDDAGNQYELELAGTNFSPAQK